MTVGQAVASYLMSLPQEDRAATGQELNFFARWFGAERSIRSITAPDLERYQEQLSAESRKNTTDRLEALRGFLFAARKDKLIDTNLAVQIKIKRKKSSRSSDQESPARESQGASDAVRLTVEGHEKLSQELMYLETEMRRKVAQELKLAAADKDFRENAPYDVAKQHQGEVEARIRELKNILETSEVVDTSRNHRSRNIDLGSTVTLLDLEENEEVVYTLVGPGEIDARRGKISIQSPVGRALSGKTVGDEVDVDVPAGTVRLRIQRVDQKR